jgi:hypothetical protein
MTTILTIDIMMVAELEDDENDFYGPMMISIVMETITPVISCVESPDGYRL